MDYPKHMYRHPGPYGSGEQSYGVTGVADEDQELFLLERGWHTSKEAAWGIDGADDLTELREMYRAKFGKRPFMGWDADTLRQKFEAEA